MSTPYASILTQGLDPNFTSSVPISGPYGVSPLNTNIGSGPRGVSVSIDPTRYGASNKAKKTKNSTIQHSYPLRPWGDGREERIMEFMPVFIARYHEKKVPLSTMLSVGQLNVLLRQAQLAFKDLEGDPETEKFKRYLDTYTNEDLEFFHQQKKKGLVDNSGELADFHSMATQDVYRYQTIFGILDRYNWLGVVLTKAQGTSLMSIDTTAYEDHVNIINVVVGEKARVHNYWGTRQQTAPGSTLFWVLKRAMTKTGNFDGPFQITPYSARERDTVPYSISKNAHVWRVGTVSENNASDVSSISSRKSALGLTSNESGVYNAVPRLPLIVVQLGI